MSQLDVDALCAGAPPTVVDQLLGWQSAVTMVVFLGINVCVAHPFNVRLPGIKRTFNLDYGTAPVIGLLLLLITTCIGWQEVVVGFIGDDMMQPYSIFILFFALAYVCVSLDLTGMFAFIALHVARSSGKSGRRLFVYFFALNSLLTVFTSNDIVILTVTPIILYFCKHRNINPVPFLMSEFVAANCLSLLLYIGNPTNIIVASAYQLSFFSYSYWMAMPAIVAGVTGLAMTWLMFRKDVPRELEPIALSRDMIRRELKDRTSAIVGSTLLLSCLAALVITSFWFVPVWMVTLPFAVAMLVKDVVSDLRNARVRGTPIDHPMKQVVKAGAFSNAEEQQHDDTMEVRREESSENIVIVDNLDGKAATSNSLARGIDHMRTRLPTVAQAFDRMPWRVGPFVISMFIIVEALNVTGWLRIFASALATLIAGKGILTSVFTIGFLSSLACVLLNNQPMTILFTKTLLLPAFACTVTPLELRGSMFALVMSSNFGANFALNGALAGLMWERILREKGVVVITYLRFMRWGTIISVPIVTLACLTLSAELAWFPEVQ